MIARIPELAPGESNQNSMAADSDWPLSIQRKLTIGTIDDPLESEAEAAAERVMRMPDPAQTGANLRRAAREIGGQFAAESKKISRLKAGAITPTKAPESVHDTLRQVGQPLERETRVFFESRFQRRFDNVRIHTGIEAANSARAVGARAYAVGSEVAFAAGQYRPGSDSGRKLIAHELAHVTQVQTADSGLTLRRFGSEEHKQLGTEASGGALSDINVGDDAAPEYLTYGEVVALAGDYFGSLEDMRKLAASKEGRQKIRWTRWLAIDQYKGVPEPALPPADKQAIKDNYYTLAAHNVSHFSAGGTADPTYQAQHTKALEIAFQAGIVAAKVAGASGVNNFDLKAAITQEAFAQHFLSDMFSGGHVRTERAAIKAWYDSNMPNSTKQIVAYMAGKIHSYLVSNLSILKRPFIPSEDDIAKQIQTMGGKALESFGLGDIVSLAWHNADSQGIAVVSEANEAGAKVPGGSKWTDLGDQMLSTSPATRSMALAAMRASLADLQTAAHIGSQSSPNAPPETAFPAALAQMKPFAAEKFIPHADPTGGNKEMVWQWQFFNPPMYNAVDATVKKDVADQITAIAGQQESPTKEALNDFASLLQIIGIHALEVAVGQDARIKPKPRLGLYGESPATP